jgi:hypothetical protein
MTVLFVRRINQKQFLMPSNKTSKKILSQAESNAVIRVGDVGYTFREEFHARWYHGVVKAILPGAGE